MIADISVRSLYKIDEAETVKGLYKIDEVETVQGLYKIDEAETVQGLYKIDEAETVRSTDKNMKRETILSLSTMNLLFLGAMNIFFGRFSSFKGIRVRVDFFEWSEL